MSVLSLLLHAGQRGDLVVDRHELHRGRIRAVDHVELIALIQLNAAISARAGTSSLLRKGCPTRR